MNPKILVVEDEENLGSTLSEKLSEEGFSVRWAKSCKDALKQLADDPPDLALLDVGLPDGTGFEIGNTIHKTHNDTSIIFLTAQGNPEDRVQGLEMGAEDYIVKPFHLREVILRINNALRRANKLKQKSEEGIALGRAKVYFTKFKISVDGEEHALTHKECAILELLFSRKGEVVSRSDILDEVWSENEYPSTRTVDNFIVRLRKWIEERPDEPKVILSVRGVGYKLEG